MLIICLFISCQDKKSEGQSEQKKGRQLELTEEVTFLDQDNEEISKITVAVADDQQERNQGLMDVTELPADAGMLFIFPTEEELSFYMANTPLPLDIMFVNADSVIIRIHHSAAPFNSKQLFSDGPAQYVVETNAGYAVSNDIREGMRVRF
ncbi:DUF192 domain-containing protein [Gracilimonas halophila]